MENKMKIAIALANRSIYNEERLRNAEKCGCYHCTTIFRPAEITEWTDKSYEFRTAICPYCGIDSVIDCNIMDNFSREALECFRQIMFE